MKCFHRAKGVAWPGGVHCAWGSQDLEPQRTAYVQRPLGIILVRRDYRPLVLHCTRSWSVVSARGYFGIAMVHNPLNRRLEHHLTEALEPQQHHNACSKDRLALARRGPNITSQQSYVVMFLDCLCLRGLVPITPTSHL